MQRLKIGYVGGGSKFVVTLLHGLAEYAEVFRRRRVRLELALFDPRPGACDRNLAYVGIAARETGMRLAARTARHLTDAIRDSDWVVYSAGLQTEVSAFCRRFRVVENPYPVDVGPDMAIVSLAVWPPLCAAARAAQRHAPEALFSVLVNPTDVLADAIHRRFGLKTAGICVEVGGLMGFLCYYLGVREDAIGLDYVGSNHCGWVTRWRVEGRDGAPRLREAASGLRRRADWLPGTDWFLDVFELCGHLRTSPYHAWPFRPEPIPDYEHRIRRWMRRCIPGHASKEAMRAAALGDALKRGEMIPPFDPRHVHPEATPYWYPNTRWTLGAIAAGLCGESAGPVPLQVRNGRVNAGFPADAFLEVPVRIDRGVLRPQRVAAPKPWMRETLCVEPKRQFAQWLGGGEDDLLTESLAATVDRFGLDATRTAHRVARAWRSRGER